MVRIFRAICASFLIAAPVSVEAQMTGTSGAYLATQSAIKTKDYASAARYVARALAFDAGNPRLLENSVYANVALGNIRDAVEPATSLNLINTGGQLPELVLVIDLIERGDYPAALGALRGENNRLAPLMRDLLIGWMHEALGEYEAAEAQFRGMGAGEDDGAVAQFGRYHLGLALAGRGQFAQAAEVMETGPRGLIRTTGNSVGVHAQILAQIGRDDRGVELLNEELATGRSNPELTDLRNRLVLRQAVDFNAVTSAQDGVADVLQTFAAVVLGGKERDFALIYSRLALHLQPKNTSSIFIAAEILEEQEQYDLAVEVLGWVPDSSPSHLRAEIARAKAMEAKGQLEVAVEILRQLERENRETPAVHTALGLMFRTSKQFDECVQSYSRAIDLIEEPQRRDWYVYYSRAVCHERGDRWDAAEADFRTALERAPEQPLVLNYLGYSMVEKGQSIDEAKGMIERAVEARPDSGFVTDSLGWVLYRLGEFEAAVPHMERAVELEPLDPIINDHLGDVLWMVGREREARFQWRRALSFEPEAEDALRIRRKLDVGLDVVLDEEARALDETQSADGG